MKTKTISRNYALDLVRVFAFCSVVSVHFFLNTTFYVVPIQGGRMYIATLTRTFFMICVPLFLMLSGYLMRTKKASRQYYLKLTRILVEYLLASICCGIYDLVINGMPNDILGYLKEKLIYLFSYELAPYSWYVEMYIGLFLLIPYLNILYANMEGQKGKKNLILTMLLLTSLPGITNILPMRVLGDILNLRILPQWWLNFYPVTYYFIGAYLSEYPLKLRKPANIALIFVTAVIAGSLSYWKSNGDIFVPGTWQMHQSGFTVIQTVLVFTLLSQFSVKPTGMIAKGLSYLSDLCFSAYLVSYIFDDYIYNRFGLWESQPIYRLEYFIVVVPLVIVLSLALSAVIQLVYRLLCQIVYKIRKTRTISPEMR